MKFLSRVLGTVAGAITGIGAGFIPGWYRFLENEDVEYTSPFLYLITLPYYLVKETIRGTIEGAKNGFLAGISYPETLNKRLTTESNNQKMSQVLDGLNRSFIETGVLSKDEEKLFLEILSTTGISHKNCESLKERYNAYQKFVMETKSVLTGKPLNEMEKPLEIRIYDQVLYCESSAFRKLVNDCSEQHIPISLRKESNPPTNEIITKEKISVFNINTVPKIGAFLKDARGLFSSLRYLLSKLGVEFSSSSNDVSALLAPAAPVGKANENVPQFGNRGQVPNMEQEPPAPAANYSPSLR